MVNLPSTLVEELKTARFDAPAPTGPVEHDSRLDGIRGFAAVSVMMVHAFWFDQGPAGSLIGKPSEYIMTLHMSRAAVLLFFITSGYVIGLTNRKAFSGERAKEYLRRRFLRIVPIYLIAILAGWLAYRSVPLRVVIENALFLQNPAWHIQPLPGDLPLWSLHNEVVYYLGFLLVWAFKPRILPVISVLFILAVADWFHGGSLSFLGGWSVGGLFWLAGLMLAWRRTVGSGSGGVPILSLVLAAFATNHLWPGVILLKGIGFPYAGESTIWLSDLALLPVTAALFCAVVGLDFPGRKLVSWAALLLPACTCILLQVMGRLWVSVPWIMAGTATIAALVIVALKSDRIGEGLFKLFRPLGGISYGLYLFHVPFVAFVGILYPWTGGSLNYLGGFLTWLAATAIVAWACEARLQPYLLARYKRHMARVQH
jgi:peptidoglycan/LPS O-acetylase OafA/YrhL